MLYMQCIRSQHSVSSLSDIKNSFSLSKVMFSRISAIDLNYHLSAICTEKIFCCGQFILYFTLMSNDIFKDVKRPLLLGILGSNFILQFPVQVCLFHLPPVANLILEE